MNKVTAKATTIVLCGLVLSFFANCGKNDDGPKGGHAEMSANCYRMQQMQQTGAQWNQPQQPYVGGACSYPYAQAANGGFTYANTSGLTFTSGSFGPTSGTNLSMACSGSQSPVYSPSKGLGCVDNTRITMSGQPVIFDLNQYTGNFYPVSTPNPMLAYQNQMGGQFNNQWNQQSWSGSNFGSNGILPTGTQVYRVCDSSELCAGGQGCRPAIGPISAGSPIGICYFN